MSYRYSDVLGQILHVGLLLLLNLCLFEFVLVSGVLLVGIVEEV